MKKLLQEFRLTCQDVYTPSPFVAGFCLIILGLGNILSGLIRLPNQLLYRVQYRLVQSWTGHHNYTRDMAAAAWFYTLYTVVGIAVLIQIVIALL